MGHEVLILKKIGVILALSLVFLCFTAGCTNPEKDFSGKLEDYFPTDLNSEWHYKVDVYGDPLFYDVQRWPVGDLAVSYSTRGRSIKSEGTYDLKLKVIRKVETPEQITAEVKIIEDGFGIFRTVQALYWMELGRNSGKPMFIQRTEYPSYYSPLPWYSISPGLSERMLLFSAKKGVIRTRINSNNEIIEDQDLQFLGQENYNGMPCLVFLRTVYPEEKSTDSHLSKGFTEQLWFGKGKGLIRLEQKIDGQTSMTWTLEKFIPG